MSICLDEKRPSFDKLSVEIRNAKASGKRDIIDPRDRAAKVMQAAKEEVGDNRYSRATPMLPGFYSFGPW